MTQRLTSEFAAVSVDLVRDAFAGQLPKAVGLMGSKIRTVYGGAGLGKRPFFLCPSCGQRMLVVYIPLGGGPAACRACHRVTHGSSRFHRTAVERHVTMLRGDAQ